MNIPIGILTEKCAKIEGPAFVSDAFIENGFIPVWCSYDIPKVIQLKSRVDLFILILPPEMNDECIALCHYLRDIGIDEEKSVFLCGSRKMQKEAQKYIPAMLILGAYEIDMGEMAYVAKRVRRALPHAGKRTGCLIIDRDNDYNSKLVLALNGYCDAVISNGSPKETSPFLKDAKLLILGVDFEMDFLDWGKLRGMLVRRNRMGDFHIIYLAKDKKRQREVIDTLSEVGMCLSKETDFIKNANYIANRYLIKDNK